MHSDTDRSAATRPMLGFGLGLRVDHYQELLDGQPAVDWLEIISENYMVPGGKPLWYLDRFAERYPLVMHGVSLSIGGADPLDRDYLRALRSLADRVRPRWFSDHLCWTGVGGDNLHDLLPLPYTRAAVRHVAGRIVEVQDFIGRPMLIENVSSYLEYRDSEMTEWQFIAEVAERADCGILLDINNIHVSAFNHGFDPQTYLRHIPGERVCQFHLAGHSDLGTHLIDTHDQPVIDPVWRLYQAAVERFGAVSTMIERDDRIPPLGELLAELDHARRLAEPILASRAA